MPHCQDYYSTYDLALLDDPSIKNRAREPGEHGSSLPYACRPLSVEEAVEEACPTTDRPAKPWYICGLPTTLHRQSSFYLHTLPCSLVLFCRAYVPILQSDPSLEPILLNSHIKFDNSPPFYLKAEITFPNTCGRHILAPWSHQQSTLHTNGHGFQYR